MTYLGWHSPFLVYINTMLTKKINTPYNIKNTLIVGNKASADIHKPPRRMSFPLGDIDFS